jgi:hypothetical protein
MSLSYFPTIYEDELMYSVFARYYVHAGYLNFKGMKDELFDIFDVDVEFVHGLKHETMEIIQKQMDWKEVIEKHTMFPYYARFLDKGKRDEIFQNLYHNEKSGKALVKRSGDKVLRYCPLCVKDDRKVYGETYWHRSHQLRDVNCCPIHKCYLIDTNISLNKKYIVEAAEDYCTCDEVVEVTNALELQVATYVMDVFQAPMDMEGEVLVGKFLHSKMEGTKYLSARGKQRNITLLYEDFIEHYQNLSIGGIHEQWQLQSIFTHHRINFFEVCQVAMFLNIPIEELTHMELPSKSQVQRIDGEIHQLHAMGMNYMDISKKINVSYNIVKPIGQGKYGKTTPRKAHTNGGAKPHDWSKIDREKIEMVKEAIIKLHGDGIERPRRVTKGAIYKMVDLHQRNLSLLPLCEEEIKKNVETHQQYWIREIRWAIQTIEREGDTLNWTHIRRLTNMKRKHFDICKMEMEELRDLPI